MTNVAFEEFVKSQQVPEHPEIDWNLRRDEWLQHLNELFKQIRAFLKEYIASGQMQFVPETIKLNEEFGTYEVPEYTLTIGRKQIKFQPVGTLLIGSKGRVDVIGPMGTDARILLVDSNATRVSDTMRASLRTQDKTLKKSGEKWEWKMVTRPPERRFIDLSQETFFQMIMEVANG